MPRPQYLPSYSCGHVYINLSAVRAFRTTQLSGRFTRGFADVATDAPLYLHVFCSKMYNCFHFKVLEDIYLVFLGSFSFGGHKNSNDIHLFILQYIYSKYLYKRQN